MHLAPLTEKGSPHLFSRRPSLLNGWQYKHVLMTPGDVNLTRMWQLSPGVTPFDRSRCMCPTKKEDEPLSYLQLARRHFETVGRVVSIPLYVDAPVPSVVILVESLLIAVA